MGLHASASETSPPSTAYVPEHSTPPVIVVELVGEVVGVIEVVAVEVVAVEVVVPPAWPPAPPGSWATLPQAAAHAARRKAGPAGRSVR
jgi:hypothetical protein